MSFCLTSLRLERSRSRKIASFLTSHRLKRYKICINGASWIKRKRGKCWISQIFEGKLWVFIYSLSEMKIWSVTPLYSSPYYSFFLPFFVLEIFKIKDDKVFIRHSASISKLECFDQPWWNTIRVQYITVSTVQEFFN